MILRRFFQTLAAGALAASCGTFVPQTAVDCTPGAGDAVAGAAFGFFVDEPAVFRVEGTAQHRDGLAIHRVLVGKVPATPKEGSFNFDHWSADVPRPVLEALTPAASGEVRLDVVAVDACGRQVTFAQIETNPFPDPVVEGLALAVDYPGDEAYLPATLAVPAAIRVTAGAKAAHADVLLEATAGSFLGAATDAPGTFTVKLQTVDAQTAAATVYFTASAPGEIVVRATPANGSGVSTRLAVEGAPALRPGSGTLTPGESQPVEVATGGRLTACEAAAPAEIEVQYAGDPVQGVFDISEDDEKRATLFLTPDADLVDAASVTLVCRDAYGQSASATFDVNP